MSQELARIAQLEDALQKTIAYLRAMPVVPETFRQAQAAEEVLKSEWHPTVLEGAIFHPSGLTTIDARLAGRTLTIRTGDLDGFSVEMKRRLKDGLYSTLKAGLTVELKTGLKVPIE